MYVNYTGIKIKKHSKKIHKAIIDERTTLSISDVGTTEEPYAKKGTLDPYLTPHIEINTKGSYNLYKTT